MVLLVLSGLVLASRFWSRGENFNNLNQDTSFRQRLATSQAGLAMFADHPMLGVGPDVRWLRGRSTHPRSLHERRAGDHNSLIQALSEFGTLGFIRSSCLSVSASIMLASWR